MRLVSWAGTGDQGREGSIGRGAMKFDDTLLALVVREPLSGYDAKKWLATDGVFIRANADQSQIYRTLHRLRRAGLIDVRVEHRDGGPDAKLYSATPAGVQRLLELADSPYEPPARWQEPDFLRRYVLLGMIRPACLLPLIDTELAFRREQVARFRNRDRSVRLAPGLVPIDPEIARALSDESHAYGSAATDSWIFWLESQRLLWAARLGLDAEAVSA